MHDKRIALYRQLMSYIPRRVHSAFARTYFCPFRHPQFQSTAMMHYRNNERAVYRGEFTLLSRGPASAHSGIPSFSGPPTHWDDGEHIGTQLVSKMCGEALEPRCPGTWPETVSIPIGVVHLKSLIV